MARMYSRKKGKAGSTKPANKKNPEWVDYKKAEVEKLIEKLNKQNYSSALIGTILRDQYGIPSVRSITGKKINEILREKKLATEIPEQMLNLMRHAVSLRKHLIKNKNDLQSKRALILKESLIRRLGKYYVRRKAFQEDWVYDPWKAKLTVQ